MVKIMSKKNQKNNERSSNPMNVQAPPISPNPTGPMSSPNPMESKNCKNTKNNPNSYK